MLLQAVRRTPWRHPARLWAATRQAAPTHGGLLLVGRGPQGRLEIYTCLGFHHYHWRGVGALGTSRDGPKIEVEIFPENPNGLEETTSTRHTLKDSLLRCRGQNKNKGRNKA